MAGTARSPVLIGRDDDLDTLHQMLQEAAAGRPGVVVVAGEAGIGKSRLLGEVARRVTEAGGRSLIGGCLDMAGGGIPFLPLLEAMRGLNRALSPDQAAALFGPARSDLAGLLPELARDGEAGKSVTGAQGLPDGGVPQARLFEVVLGLLDRLAADAPILLLFEDVHWIDRASRDLVTFLARNLSRERVLLALTLRTDDVAVLDPLRAWLAELERGPSVRRLSLERLDRGAVARQMETISGSRPSAPDVERIWSRSDGNPFFVEELLAAHGRGQGDHAPRTLSAILATRLHGVSGAAREVIAALAVAERPAGETLLGSVVGRSEADLVGALREGLDRQVLVMDRSQGTYRFRHALLREVAEDELLPAELRDLHQRYSETLTQHPDLADRSPAGAAAELAHHWDAAGRTDEAYLASVEAAAAAESVAAHAQALRHYERALALVPLLSPDIAVDRVGLLRRAVDAADLASEIPRAIEHARAALELIDETVEPTVAGLLHSRMGYLTWVSGDGPGGLLRHRKAESLVPAEPPTRERAQVLGALGGALMGLGRYEESRQICESAIVCATAAGARSEEARARNMLGSDLVALGKVAEGLVELERSRELAAQAGPPEMLVVAHHNFALNLAQAGRLDMALAEATDGREAARRLGLDRRYGPDLAALTGDVLLRLGRWDEAEAVTLEGLELDPAGRGTVYLSAVRGRLHALRGEADPARERFDTAVGLAVGDVDPHLAAFIARGRAELLLGQDESEAAAGAVEAGLQGLLDDPDPYAAVPLLALGLQAAAELADAARAARDDDAVQRAIAMGRPWQELASGMSGRKTDPVLGPLLDLAGAEVARLGGRADRVSWLATAERFDALPEPYLAAYARFRAAEAELRARGIRGEASEPLSRAHASAGQLGAEPLLRRIEGLAVRARIDLGRARIDPDRAPVDSSPPLPTARVSEEGRALEPDRPSGLSAREVEVLRLVARGMSNGEIAERLFITRKTAGVHVTHILDKLGVDNRVEAAMVAVRLGLAGPETE
ncbi:MAG: AAA family ATPase [Chloroflexi bacterium]|nr:AAA family ATPase [Chloroflexota bacterium]